MSKVEMDSYEQVAIALKWFGIDAEPCECDFCEDGSVYFGLTKII